MGFKVIDKRTGKEPIFDGNHIFKEKWFKESNLIYCDIDGWYISEDGYLVLVDDCGRVGYPPQDRFNIIYEPERQHGEWEYNQYDGNLNIGNWHCSECRHIVFGGYNQKPYFNFCPNCGADMREGEVE